MEGSHGVKIWLRLTVKSNRLVSVSLDLRANDVLGQCYSAMEEVRVVVGSTIASATASIETIEVKLPLEACVLRLVEESRHDRRREHLRLVDLEGPSVREPRYDRFLPLVPYLIQHAVEFDGEGVVNAAAGATLAGLWGRHRRGRAMMEVIGRGGGGGDHA